MGPAFDLGELIEGCGPRQQVLLMDVAVDDRLIHRHGRKRNVEVRREERGRSFFSGPIRTFACRRDHGPQFIVLKGVGVGRLKT